ncbi:MAG: hypothetical protein IKQ95_10150 [Synergistaceae bacterium]|nr:hypothetical protein [Synergistaceae bacterium]
MTDITEDDIKLVTLNSVVMNGQYNDLALMVKGRLIIFAEAQSTWSINILIRLLLYLSSTYYDYIIENGLNVYGSKKINIPEPEFYVIYTGSRKIDKDIISMRQDFWQNPNAKLDILVKVIHSENKNDIIGQYIIFTHVLDSQIKIHGRTREAAENTIRICQNDNVLKEYLESLEKEVITIMIMLFKQDYVTEKYAQEREKEGEKRGKKKGKIEGAMENTVKMCRRFGATLDEAINMLAQDFGLTAENAAQYVRKLWEKS